MNKLKPYIVGALIAGSVPVLEALANWDPAAITDWRAWVVGLGAGFVRQVAVYLISKIASDKI